MMVIESFLDELKNIRTQKSRDGNIKPHKYIMLLSVIDLIESRDITENRIYFSQALIDQFVSYFNIISKGDDWCQPGPPFFHLRSSKFWRLHVKPGRETEYSKINTSGGGIKRIVDNIEYASLFEPYYLLLLDEKNRDIIRYFILNTFFDLIDRQRLQEFIQTQTRSAVYAENLLNPQNEATIFESKKMVRDIAFRRVILRVYDNQCAVCGFRIIYPTFTSPIDAAHLIPWSLTNNDQPSNGIALCKLHHWALDAHLITPTKDLKWKVSQVLDPRRNSEYQLTKYDNLDILLPSETAYIPSMVSIDWCIKHLLS